MIKILTSRSAAPHVVYISIVGCDRMPLRYHRAKYGCELVLERSQLPVTVVRATQFHTLIEQIAHTATLGPFSLVARGMSFQPCDHRWVAAELADIAAGPAPAAYLRARDLTGPERVSLAEAMTLIRAEDGKPPPRFIAVPAVGGTLRAYQAGANLPGPDAKIGGSSFREFLASSLAAPQCQQPTYTQDADGLHRLQTVQTVRKLREPSFLTQARVRR
jgi:uncharacterized protein YbjT (DUF2867 family)